VTRQTGRATLRDVAQASGVSVQTVSNVLNNPERVAPETLGRVRADITRLGFRPNLAARSLRKQRADALGIQIPSVQGRSFGTIHESFVSALTSAAQEDGAHLIPFVADTHDVLDHYEQLLATRVVDGFVLTDTRPEDPRPGWLQERGVPFVSFGRIWSDPTITAWVDVDGATGTTAAVDHAAAAGYRRLAFLGWPDGSPVGDDRRLGWERRCVETGRDTDLRATTINEVMSAQRATATLLDDLELGDALLCVSDSVALGAVLALADRGLRPGQDIGVIGFDDCDFAAVFGITTVRQPVGRIAAHVISRLRSEDSPAAGTLISPSVVPRRSTVRHP
jgi:DNA-binding LacI/PurR family transcriptional regulator